MGGHFLNTWMHPLTSRLLLDVRRNRGGAAGLPGVFNDPDHLHLFISHQKR